MISDLCNRSPAWIKKNKYCYASHSYALTIILGQPLLTASYPAVSGSPTVISLPPSPWTASEWEETIQVHGSILCSGPQDHLPIIHQQGFTLFKSSIITIFLHLYTHQAWWQVTTHTKVETSQESTMKILDILRSIQLQLKEQIEHHNTHQQKVSLTSSPTNQ